MRPSYGSPPPIRMRGALLFVLALSALACARAPEGDEREARVPVAAAPEAASTARPRIGGGRATREPLGPPSARALVDAIDARVRGHLARAERRADDWLSWQLVASELVDRAALSGDIEDLSRASHAVDRAAVIAGSERWLARARLEYAVHRLRAAESALDRAEAEAALMPSVRDDIDALRADLAFHSGRYDEALARYDARLARARDAATLVARAQYAWRTGDLAQADALLDEADARAASAVGAERAWLALVRGTMELDLGRFEAASRTLARGLEEVPEHPALEELYARSLLARGLSEEAERRYLELAGRTGAPEHYDALALIERALGDSLAAEALSDLARRGHEWRMSRLPEAAYGHALPHYLELEEDPSLAVEIARRNVEARPGGEARVSLARALLRADALEEASTEIEQVMQTPWRSVELLVTRAELSEALGDVDGAEAAWAEAERLAPGARERARR